MALSNAGLSPQSHTQHVAVSHFQRGDDSCLDIVAVVGDSSYVASTPVTCHSTSAPSFFGWNRSSSEQLVITQVALNSGTVRAFRIAWPGQVTPLSRERPEPVAPDKNRRSPAMPGADDLEFESANFDVIRPLDEMEARLPPKSIYR